MSTGVGIGTVEVTGGGCRVAYVKMCPGSSERHRVVAGSAPGLALKNGWRVGVGICRDTRIPEHLGAVADLDVDLYVAGLVHHPGEAHEFDVRAHAISARLGVPVVFAGFAGPTGEVFSETSGGSAVWDSSGNVLARAGNRVGEHVAVTLNPPAHT